MEMVTVFKWNEDIVKMDNDFGDYNIAGKCMNWKFWNFC